MNTANPLDELRDIHLPDPVSAWPPAPGWWILAAIILTLIIWIGMKLWKRYQQKQLFRLSNKAVIQLEKDYAAHQNPQLLVKQYSTLLRRIALARYPRHQVAALTGKDWLDFLDSTTKLTLFNAEAGQLLLDGPYQDPKKTIASIDSLTWAVHNWIKNIDSNKSSVQAFTDSSGSQQ